MSNGCLAGMAFASGKGPPPIYASTGVHGFVETFGTGCTTTCLAIVAAMAAMCTTVAVVFQQGGSEDSVREHPG